MNDTDRDWERWAGSDPYFAVLVDDAYRGRPDGEAWERFMASGHREVDALFHDLRRMAGDDVRPGVAVELGCGVGRLLIPLANRSAEAIGVDVSPTMRSEAEANLARCGVTNARVVAGDDALTHIPEGVDLVYSANVFQHLPIRRGLALTAALLERLRPGGVFALHYAIDVPGIRAAGKRLAARSQLLVAAGNLARGRPASAPMMQMNAYPLPRLLALLDAHGCREVNVVSSTYRRNRFVSLRGQLPEHDEVTVPS